jgi:hypothetical protein
MQININFVLFEELQEKPDDSRAVAAYNAAFRIMPNPLMSATPFFPSIPGFRRTLTLD